MKKNSSKKDGANRRSLSVIAVNVLVSGVLIYGGFTHVEQRETIREAQALIEEQEMLIDIRGEKLAVVEEAHDKLKQTIVESHKKNEELTKRVDAQAEKIDNVMADMTKLEDQKKKIQNELEVERKKYKALLK